MAVTSRSRGDGDRRNLSEHESIGSFLPFKLRPARVGWVSRVGRSGATRWDYRCRGHFLLSDVTPLTTAICRIRSAESAALRQFRPVKECAVAPLLPTPSGRH